VYRPEFISAFRLISGLSSILISKSQKNGFRELKDSRFHPAGQLSLKNTQDLLIANSRFKRKASISSEPETIEILRAKLAKAEGKKAKNHV
jgi:hypothetical protein